MEFALKQTLSRTAPKDLDLKIGNNMKKSGVEHVPNQSLSLNRAILISHQKASATHNFFGIMQDSPAREVSLPTSTLQQQTEKKVSTVFPTSSGKKKSARTKKVRKWTKPKDKPKRPLSAYNLFYRDQREVMLCDKKRSNNGNGSSKKGLGFGGMAKEISMKWNLLNESARVPYERQARFLRKKYFEDIEEWKQKRKDQVEEHLGEKEDSFRDDTIVVEEAKSPALPCSTVMVTPDENHPSPVLAEETSPHLQADVPHFLIDDEPIPYTFDGSNTFLPDSDPVLDSIVESLDIGNFF